MKIKKINTENCNIELNHDSFVCTNTAYGDHYNNPSYELEATIKDKETGKVVDSFTFEFNEYGIQDLDLDGDINFRRYIVGKYSDIDLAECDEDYGEIWNDDEDDYEAAVIYNNMSKKQQKEVDNDFDEYIKEMNLDGFDFYYLENQFDLNDLLEQYLDGEDVFYSIGANGTVILYKGEISNDFNDHGDMILVGKGIKKVYNINTEDYIQKKDDTYFSVDYCGKVTYWEKTGNKFYKECC